MFRMLGKTDTIDKTPTPRFGLRGDSGAVPEPVLSAAVLSHLPIASAVLTPGLRVRVWDLQGVDVTDADEDHHDTHVADLPWWREDDATRDFVTQSAQRALAGHSGQFEGPFLRADGSTGRLWLQTNPFRETPEGEIAGVLMTAQDISTWAKDREAGKAVVDELRHRVKNMLSLVSSIVNLNLRQARSLDDAKNRVGHRLAAYARAQDLVFEEGLRDVAIADVVARGMSPFPSQRLTADAVEGSLSARSAMMLGLALHELGTNAVKHGAWSNGTGRVEITSRVLDDGALAIRWRESGGPVVRPPERKGFGTTLTTGVLESQTRGAVKTDYAPDGMVWDLVTGVPVQPVED